MNVDQYGLNLDSANTLAYSSVNFRSPAGDVLGRVSYGASPFNSGKGALMLSALNLNNVMEVCALIDPRDSTQADSGDNPICLKAGGNLHRLRRDPTTGAAFLN